MSSSTILRNARIQSSSVRVGDTARPLLGQIVEVPAHISTPEVYVDQRREEITCSVGRVVEVQENLISVLFFGYPTPWDYSMREANQFTLALG